jgi:hypothetical protein
MKLSAFVALFVISQPSIFARQGPPQRDVKPDPLDSVLVNAPPEFHETPLSVVLGHIGFASAENFVMFGTEVETANGREPLISARIEPGVTVREALTQVLAELSGYTLTKCGATAWNE